MLYRRGAFFCVFVLIYRDNEDGKDRIALLSQKLSCSTLYNFFKIMYNKLRKLKKSEKGDIACRLW